MAKHTHRSGHGSSGHGRSGDPRRRAAEEVERARAEASPELEEVLAAAYASGHPLDIAMLASAMLASVEPDRHPAEHHGAELPQPAEVVDMFLHSDNEQLRVLAWTVAQLLPDPRLHARVDAALAPEVIPGWLAPLAEPYVVGAWQVTDRLRDSSDVVISLRIGDQDLTVIGLIDFNLDAALKDGFAIPAALSEVRQALDARGQSGMDRHELTPADARAWLAEAIDIGRDSVPPLTSDSWPQARPLLEWAVRQCPAGGRGRPQRTWTTAEIEDVVAQFAGSPEGAVIGDREDRAVLTDALRVLTCETQSDPMLISPVRLELGLNVLWSTTLHHDLDRLTALPHLLRGYVRWAHAQRAIPGDQTDEALAVIAHRGATFVRDVTELLEIAGRDDLI